MDQNQIEMESVRSEMTEPEEHRLIMIQATEREEEYHDRQNWSVRRDRQ